MSKRDSRDGEIARDRSGAIVEASPSAILMVDAEGVIQLANTKAEHLFGYSREELVGQKIELLVPERYLGRHREDRVNFLHHPTTRPMGAGRDLFCRRKDGSELPVEIGLSPMETDEGTFVLASIIDITERKRREEQLHLQSMALESAANAIVITDANGKIIWVNKAFTESTGYFPEEVIGKNPRILKSGQGDENFYKDMWDTILAGKVWRNTIVNRRKDGSLINEDMTITPIRDTAGNITQFIAIKQDITELEKAVSTVRAKNEELATMTQQLWQASRLATVGELAASIAHELNNPLATISLRLEMLAEQLNGDEPKHHAVEVVADEVERMGNLVGNLLQFSRRTHQQISTINVREEVERSLELVEYHLRSNNIVLERDFADGLSPIQADRQQLRQVFLNLLTNAADAMPEGGQVTVRIGPKKDDSGRNLIQLLFIDRGAGIDSENLEKIWDPFFTTKPEGKGTGLGLAICRRVIEEHHGSIEIESTVGQGTTVIVQLPTSNSNSSILEQDDNAEAIEASDV